MNKLPYLGKGCYIWQQAEIAGGDIGKIVQYMLDARVQHVCMKVMDGVGCFTDRKPEIANLARALRAAGIRVGAWGYIYLKWIPKREAENLARGALAIGAEYVLLDIESPSAFRQWTAGSIFMKRYRELLPSMPTGLNTYWKPSWHTEIPYSKTRPHCDFDSPQVYARGNDPVSTLMESVREYKKLWPVLDFALPAGDMYFEGGQRVPAGDVLAFMQAARKLPEAVGCVMWCADQRETTPELWAEFAAYDWEKGQVEEEEGYEEPAMIALYAAVVNCAPPPIGGLFVRSYHGTSGQKLRYLVKGDRVTVFEEEGIWARISSTEQEWVSKKYLVVL